MKKWIFSMILTLALCLGLLPAVSIPAAAAAAIPTVDSWNDAIYANGTPLLIAAHGEGTAIYIDTNGNGEKDDGELSLQEAGVVDADHEFRDGSDYYKYAIIYGGSNDGAVESTRITMTGGKVQFIYGGSGAYGSVTGDTEVIIKGGAVHASVYGGGCNSIVGGKASVTMSGGAVGAESNGHGIYGGGDERGSVTGSTEVTITGGTPGHIGDNYGDVNGGGDDGGIVTGKAKVTITGGTMDYVNGGGDSGTVGSTEILIDTGSTVTKDVYGGQYWGGSVGKASITIKGTVGGSVYGGSRTYGGSVGSTEVLVDTGGKVAGNVYGGSNTNGGSVGSANVLIGTGGTVTGNVYGGGMRSTVGSVHVKCENGGAGKITFDAGISRTASGDFQSVTAGDTIPVGYFEYVSAGHLTATAADANGHTAACEDSNCPLYLSGIQVGHDMSGQVCTVCGYTLYNIWVGGVQVGGVPDDDGNITVTGDTITGTVTYAPASAAEDDPDTSVLENAPTLTLDSASITAAETPVDVDFDNTPPCGIYSRPALNLVLTGENTITASTTDYSNGVKADAMDLAISGGGSLEINTCGYGIHANTLVADGVTLEIIDSVYAISLNTGCAIEDSTVSAVGSDRGISTINGTIGIDNSSVYVKGESYSFYGSADGVSVHLGSGAHVKAEGAIRVQGGVNSDGSGYLRGTSDGTFTLQSSGSLEYSGDYFEYLGAGHCTFSPVAGSEAHAIECEDENRLLKLTNASAPHRWNATADGVACADCPATAVASVTADTTTAYYYGIGNAVSAADGNSNAVLKLFADVETVTVSTGGFTLDPNGRSIETLNFESDSSSIGLASKLGNTPVVTMAAPGVFATPGEGVTLDPAWFTSTTTGYVVVKENDNLKLTKGITDGMVTLSSDSFTYNGRQQNPTVTVTWTDSSKLVEGQHYAVGYKDSKGDWVFPTDAGTYTVVITGMNGYAGEVEKTYTINKAPVPTITYPAAGGLTYGQTLADSALSGGSTEYGSFAWKDETTVPAVGNATGYPVTFAVNENTAKNYETITTTEQNVQVNVTQAAPGISLSASVSGASGNRTVELTATMSAAGSGALPTGTVRFVNATDGGSTEIGTANVSDGTATCTWTATEDKVYTIRAVYNGDTNYQAVNTSEEVDTRKQPQAVLTITGGTTIAYGQTLTLATSGGTTNGTVTYTVTPSNVASVSGNVLTPTTVGSVTVTATMAGNDTYLDVTSAPVTITITQGTGIGSVTMAGWTYGETAKTPAVTSETNGTDNVTYLYESTDGKGYSSDAAPTTAGAYKVTATFAATDLYAKTTDSAEFTVEKAEPAVKTVPTATRIQRGKKLEASTIKGGEMIGVDGTTLEGTFTWKAPETVMDTTGNIDAIVVFTPNDTTNYKAVEITVSVEVYTTSGGIVVTPTYYDVKFDTNGAGTIAKQTIRRNSTATEPADPVKDGYTFGGWYTDKECTKAYNFDTKVTKDITLYAKWTENKPVTPEVTEPCDGTAADNCPSLAFSDLDTTQWYHSDVDYVLNKGMMNGMGGRIFAPNGNLSRAMLVTILWRLEGEPVQETSADFFDVPAGQWYTDAIQWASANGIVNGYGNGLFGPNDDITREQLATILYRYEQYKGGGFVGAWMFRMDYVDLAEVSDWAYEAMCWMTMNGIVNGRPGKVLDPKSTATRAEAATMLYRYCEVSGKEEDN